MQLDEVFQSLKNMCVKSFCFLHGKTFISNSYIQVTHVIVKYSSVSNQNSKSKTETDKAFKKRLVHCTTNT